jgi:hypothetical protein
MGKPRAQDQLTGPLIQSGKFAETTTARAASPKARRTPITGYVYLIKEIEICSWLRKTWFQISKEHRCSTKLTRRHAKYLYPLPTF